MPAIKDFAFDLHSPDFLDISSSCLRSSVAISPTKRSVTTMATGCLCCYGGRTAFIEDGASGRERRDFALKYWNVSVR